MNILIIDDEKSIRFSLKVGIQKLEGVSVYTAESGEEGLEIIKSKKIDLAIIDIKLPGIDGIEVLETIHRLKIDMTVIMITYISEVRLAVKAMKLGAYDYFTKPFKIADVVDSINSLRDFINKKTSIIRYESNELIGTSASTEKIRNTIKIITDKNLNTSVLIMGESGTGKEIVAKSIAKNLGESRPFIALNCAAIPKSLQESELFGYEKGAFSEAQKRKIGLMEKANGGVLFLDEVGDMDISLQQKLLRVLQEKKFRRVGGLDEVPFDAMLISATNRDLKFEIKNESFREDLFYRLNVIPITLEPLRNRKEDIPDLLNHFLEFYKSKVESSIAGISDEAMKLLMEYDWYGNVRELKNTVERIMILSNNSMIEIEDLPHDVFIKRNHLKEQNFETAEKEVILNALKKHEFNITHTAKELNITRTTLRSKINKYNIRND
ncbi:MAG: sigma-54 dependent transcriptional regulator [Eubacteriales bacterium]|nr:sigma-54 dependent transcriptional regulator [Eubacteriales bacterium]